MIRATEARERHGDVPLAEWERELLQAGICEICGSSVHRCRENLGRHLDAIAADLGAGVPRERWWTFWR